MLKIDPILKDLIPPLQPDEYKVLEESIKAEGCRDKIVTWRGYIVDGHNRYDICTRYGIEYETDERFFEDIEAVKVWMIDNQKGRRNLTDGWKWELAQTRKAILAEKGRENLQKPTGSRSGMTLSNVDKVNTQATIAQELGWSTGKVAMADKVWKEADPEVKEKVKAGEVSINQAYQEVRKQQKVQERQEKQKKLDSAIQSIKESVTSADGGLAKGWHKIGSQYLYHGSNTDKEFIDFLPVCKFAFADPPYNAGVDNWDNDFTWQQDYIQDIAEYVAVTPGGWNAYGFYQQTKMTYQWEMACWIKNGMTHGRCGFANWIKVSIFGKKPKISQDFFSININPSETDDTHHKGRKPYPFMAHLIELFTDEGDKIVDPFAGSGTTLLISERMNRISFSAEINERYCIEIINRAKTNDMQYEKV